GVTRRDVARSDTRGSEASQGFAADEEAVLDADGVAEILDVADLARKARNPLFCNRVVRTRPKPVAQEGYISAKSGKVVDQADVIAICRIEAVIPLVIEQFLPDRRTQRRTLLLADETGGVRSDVLDRVFTQGVAQGLSQRLGDLVAQPQREACVLLVEAAFVLEVP